MKKTILLVLAVALLVPMVSMARIGVGVGTGKIILDKDVNSGGIYQLPVLTVLNTGDEPSEYGVRITYHNDQPEMRPERSWFSFSPENFHLEPGKAQMVNISLNLPVKTKPGDYFAFVEGYPTKTAEGSGGAQIGVAAAAKLYFTVAPSNIFEGTYYRVAALMINYAPWSYVILSVIFLAIIVVIIRKKFKFQFSVGKK